TRDDLELAVFIQIGHGQAAELVAAAEGVPCPDDAAEAVVDGELVGVAADDDLQRAVSCQVGDGDAGPDAVAARGPPLKATVSSVQGHDLVRAPDDILFAVTVEVCDSGRGVPAGTTVRPRKAPTVLPHQAGRAPAQR